MPNKERNKIFAYRFVSVLIFMALWGSFKAVAACKEQEIDLYGHVFQCNTRLTYPRLVYPLLRLQVEEVLQYTDKNKLLQLKLEMDVFADSYQMDDLAYVLFTQKVAKHLWVDPNLCKIFQYQLLKEKGFKLLLGYNTEQLTVYGHFLYDLANVAEVTFNQLQYSDLSFNQDLALCEEQLIEFSGGVKVIEINQHHAPNFNALQSSYNFQTEFNGISYHFEGPLNQSLIAYYRDLPSIAFGEIYLNYQLSGAAYKQLIGDLKNAVKKMSTRTQLDFLLHLAQVVIPYQTDKKGVGREKFAFPEEVLGNRAGDCEDKSILFAYLVKEVLQLPSLALVYVHQNHLNVAVAVSGTQYNFMYNNQKYIVCEPSGAGLNAGENLYDWKNAHIVAW